MFQERKEEGVCFWRSGSQQKGERGEILSPGRCLMSEDTFGCHATEWEREVLLETSGWWVVDKCCAQHQTMHRTAATTRNDPTLNDWAVLRLRSLVLEDYHVLRRGRKRHLTKCTSLAACLPTPTPPSSASLGAEGTRKAWKVNKGLNLITFLPLNVILIKTLPLVKFHFFTSYSLFQPSLSGILHLYVGSCCFTHGQKMSMLHRLFHMPREDKSQIGWPESLRPCITSGMAQKLSERTCLRGRTPACPDRWP